MKYKMRSWRSPSTISRSYSKLGGHCLTGDIFFVLTLDYFQLAHLSCISSMWPTRITSDQTHLSYQ